MHKFKQIIILSSILCTVILFPKLAQAACEFHNITGFVWSRNSGWVSLNCSGITSNNYGLDIDFAVQGPTVDLTGYAWSSNMGWLNFDPAGPYPSYGNVQFDATFFRNIGISPTTTAGHLRGWAKWEALGDDGWTILGPIDINNTDYGVEIGADRLFTGWSWNGVETGGIPTLGDGWVMWDSELSGGGASVLAYWFETLYGDIYSGGNINSSFSPPYDRYNATYLIQANGTIAPVMISSDLGEGVPAISETFGSFLIPDESNDYKGSLAWLDKAGMINGRYGATEPALPSGNNIKLDGKIYHYTADLTLNQPITFQKGNIGEKGNGTIIVDGDLTINADMFYQSGSLSTKIENLPSVAWIVKGDIVIHEDVENLVGIFYSEGTISTGTKGVSQQQIEVPLRVDGMFVANLINLERIFADQTQEPSELIVFDGRALINPPPGLEDIGKGLPILRETRQ